MFDAWENGDLMKWECQDRMTEQEDIAGNKNKTSEII